MQEMAREMERTTYVRKVITDMPAPAVLIQAQEFFKAAGYRATKGGSPNTVRLQGRAEGALPAVIGEVGVRTSSKGRTIVSLSGYGARLRERLEAFYDLLRAARLPQGTRQTVQGEQPALSRTAILEEEMLEKAEAEGTEVAFNREEYEKPGS